MSEENLGGKIHSLESIFKWKPVIYEENLNEISCELEPQPENQFNFNNFVIHLVRSYEAAENNNVDLALETLRNLESAAKEFTDEADGGFFRKIQHAYYHMIYASMISLFIREKKYKDVSSIVNKPVPIDTMDEFNKSAIYAMKSAVFALYSNEDTQKAFASIDKALRLDPDNGQWNFLKALCIRKIRKMTNPFESPTLQEKELFKKAFDCNPKNIVYKLYLADVYREISSHALKRQDDCSHFLPKDSSLTNNLRSNIDEKISLAVDYYKQAVKDYPDNPYVMFRSAEGLARLYPKQNNIALAKQLVKKGLEKSPENVTGNLVMAFLCEYIDKNFKEAERHLKKCQSKRIFDAEMNMIRYLHSTRPNKFNSIEALGVLLEKYKEKKRHAILYSQMVSYYLFAKPEAKPDLEKACESAIKFYSLNTGSTCMLVHRSCFISSKNPFSLIDVLNDEVKFVMNGMHTTKELRECCEKYILFINFQNIKVIQGFPQNFRMQIIQGKPMIVNQNCFQPSKKFDRHTNKQLNGGRGDRRDQPVNNHSNAPNAMTGNRRPNNQQQPKNPPANINKLPSLMNTLVGPSTKPAETLREPIKPATPVEQVEPPQEEPNGDELETGKERIMKVEPPQEETNRDALKTREEEIMKVVRQMLGKNGSDSKESLEDRFKRLVLGEDEKTTRRDSDSDSDSDRRRRKDGRREHYRRHRRSDSYSDSDNSSKYDRRYHRRHKRHSSSDSDYSKASRRRSHKKDRYERDYSPRDRRGRRNRHHSSDEDVRSSYRRDRDNSLSTERRRRNRRDSRSPSYDRHSRYRSPKKDKSSRKDRKHSPDRYSRDGREKKSSKRYDRDSSYHEKKSRRRSTSREKSEHHRGKKATKSKKDRDPKEQISKTKRDQNSSRESPSE